MSRALPYGRQTIEDDDIEAVTEALKHDFLTTGPKIEEFEAVLCKVTGAKHAVACSNGTTALHLAALALGIGEGDSVIVPSVTFLATANAVRFTGADVVFADVNPETGLMEVGHAEEALKRAKGNTKAVFSVPLGGHATDLEGLSALAKANDLKLLADSCHALGGSYKDTAIGACQYEELSTFSFHPVKNIAMGEGGAVTTNNEDWASQMRILRSHGMERTPEAGPWAYKMDKIGYNYRVTDIQCALGLSQLKKLERFVARRKELVSLYDEALQSLAPIVRQPVRSPDNGGGWHLYSVRIDFEAAGVSRADLMTALKEKGIGTQVHYIPVHTQPYYTDLYGEAELPGAMAYYEHTLSLPLFPAMQDEDVSTVVKALEEALSGSGAALERSVVA